MMIGSLLDKRAPGTIQENRGLTIATGNKKKVSVRLRTLTGTTLEGQRLKSVQGTKKESLSQRTGMVLGRLLLKTTNETHTSRIAATNRMTKIDAMKRENKKIVDTQKKRQNGITSRMKTIHTVLKVNLI